MQFQNPVFIPGPTNIPDVLRKACDLPTVDHRSPAFGQVLHPTLANLGRILKSERAAIYVFPATGTGGWETAISNTLSPGDRVLMAQNGMFSQKWIDMCRRFGLDVQVVEVPWGAGVPAEAFGAILAEDRAHRIKAVLATHNETATGVVSHIAGVRRAMDGAAHPALLLVDGVSSIASMDFRFDDWGVDVAVTGSQKGFMLPPGLAIVGFSERARAAAKTARLPRCFFDIRDMEAGYAADAYPYTPAVGLIAGLRQSTEMLLEEGLENVFARHTRIAGGVRAAVRAWGLGLCARSPDLYSDTVSAIVTPEGFDTARIVAHAARHYDMAFGAGLGAVAGKVFRIGHLGSLTDAMTLSGLATAEMVMVDLGLDITLGTGVAAAQSVYLRGKAGTVQEAA